MVHFAILSEHASMREAQLVDTLGVPLPTSVGFVLLTKDRK